MYDPTLQRYEQPVSVILVNKPQRNHAPHRLSTKSTTAHRAFKETLFILWSSSLIITECSLSHTAGNLQFQFVIVMLVFSTVFSTRDKICIELQHCSPLMLNQKLLQIVIEKAARTRERENNVNTAFF